MTRREYCKGGSVTDGTCTKCGRKPVVARKDGLPRLHYPPVVVPEHRRCADCGTAYKGKTRRYCDTWCRNTAAVKVKIARSDIPVATDKACTKCGVTKAAYEFTYMAGKKDRLSNHCRVCQQEKNAEYRANNPRSSRDSQLKRSFGISVVEYDAMLAWQGGSCAFCGKQWIEGTRAFAVDHDHDSGAVRGILCHYCNKYVVGAHSLDTARKIVDYLADPPADRFFGCTRKVPPGMERPVKRRRRRYGK